MALKRDTYTSPSRLKNDVLTSRQAWRFVKKPYVVILGETASSADLGGSSKYSNENFED